MTNPEKTKPADSENLKSARGGLPESTFEIGCQGWNYADWVTPAGGAPVFYPRGTKSAEMLRLYAKIFRSIEVDSTFYAIPPAATVENWYLKTPENFTFSLKLPQEITHEKELSPDSFETLEAFCERISELREKLASVLVQLPPSFEGSRANARKLREFLKRLPGEIKFAVEFRHPDWLIDWTFRELETRGVALCLCEGGWIPREVFFQAKNKTKANFAYVRFMGERDLAKFDRIYRLEDARLEIWAQEISKIEAEKIFVYFSNFFEGHAPASANKLKVRLGQNALDPGALENQGSLF